MLWAYTKCQYRSPPGVMRSRFAPIASAVSQPLFFGSSREQKRSRPQGSNQTKAVFLYGVTGNRYHRLLITLMLPLPTQNQAVYVLFEHRNFRNRIYKNFLYSPMGYIYTGIGKISMVLNCNRTCVPLNKSRACLVRRSYRAHW